MEIRIAEARDFQQVFEQNPPDELERIDEDEQHEEQDPGKPHDLLVFDSVAAKERELRSPHAEQHQEGDGERPDTSSACSTSADVFGTSSEIANKVIAKPKTASLNPSTREMSLPRTRKSPSRIFR